MQLEWDGVRVDVTREGDAGRGCMLLHGWMCSAEMMAPIAHELSKDMRTAAIDFPGHGKNGRSPAPHRTWGVPGYMEMTAEAIRQLDMGPCDIIAHSFGARVAILLASTYPELVGRMVLTGAAGLKKPPTEAGQKRRNLYNTLKKGVNLAEKLRLPLKWTEQWREALIQRFGSEDYKALDQEMRKTFNEVISLDLTDRLPLIQAPTLLFWGEKDEETPLWMGKKMEELIPDAGLVIEEGTGHFAYLERGDVFARIVKTFLLEGRD